MVHRVFVRGLETLRRRRDLGAGAVATSSGTGEGVTALRRCYAEHAPSGGVDPTRFGDWEYGGRCTDF